MNQTPAEVSRHSRWAERIPLRRLPQPAEPRLSPTWQQARVSRIERSLRLSQQRDPGGWYVVGASKDLAAGDNSRVRTVNGLELVIYRTEQGRFVAGPGACPHMGALLTDCVVFGEDIFCRWHGLELGPGQHRGWRTFATHDDGVLLWVNLPTEGECSTLLPRVFPRPPLADAISAVVEIPATCEPRDIIANRLDPWHGSWFHPYAFSHLEVDENRSTDAELFVEVAFRVNRTWGVPVLARFLCPDARTIVMQIVEGEGAGSVVETHATPLGVDERGRDRTMMVEATVAHSPRTGFALARRAAALVRPLIRRTARQLWVDDLAYAERRYALRQRGD